MNSIVKKIKNRKINKELESINNQIQEQEKIIQNLNDMPIYHHDEKASISTWLNPQVFYRAESELNNLKQKKKELESRLK